MTASPPQYETPTFSDQHNGCPHYRHSGMVDCSFTNPLTARYSRPGGPWEDQTLARLLLGMAQRDDVLSVDGQVVGTGEFVDAVQRVAGGLRERGVGRGDAIAWQLPNGLDPSVLYWAAWWLGATAVPLHPDAAAREVDAVLAATGAGIVLSSSDDVNALAGSPVTTPDCAPDSVAVVLTTSGASGHPKSVIHTHRTLAYKARQIAVVHQTGLDDAVLMPAPMAHLAGMLHGALHPVATGAKAVVMQKWDPELALDLVRTQRVTMLFGPPVYALGIAGAAGFRREDVASVRLISSGGTTITEEYARFAHEEFGAVVKRSYGSTEAPVVTSSFPGDPPERGWTTDGRVIGDAELEIRDAVSGAPVRSGEEGELWLRGPELAEGYVDREQTDASFVDGWFRTWDRAVLDDGWLRVSGRSGDVIIRGGMNVSASEIEAALERHPAVREAIVVGYPDDVYGERIGAFVVSDEPIDRESCRAWFAEYGLARYKVPDTVMVVDAIPVLATFQKPDRAALRDRLARETRPS
jgi:acyl-CoA synthetase (AMP-forming)/AMP-acid ligase II